MPELSIHPHTHPIAFIRHHTRVIEKVALRSHRIISTHRTRASVAHPKHPSQTTRLSPVHRDLGSRLRARLLRSVHPASRPARLVSSARTYAVHSLTG